MRKVIVGCLLLLSQVTFSQNILRVWAVDDGEKIKKTTLNHQLRTNALNKVWVGDSIHLFGGKNEIVAFQLIIEATATMATSVNVTLDSLYKSSATTYTIKNAAGSVGDPYNYVGKQIEMFVAHYQNIPARSSSSVWWFGAARPLPDADFVNSTTRQPNLPDQLVPFEAASGPKTNGQGGAPFSVTASENQSVWVDITIPRLAQAGMYYGSLKVTEGGTLRYTIPVELKVYNFTLSDTTHLKNFFHIDYPGIVGRHGVTKWSAPYWSLMDKYYRMGHRHRFDVTDGRLTLSNFSTNIGKFYTGTGYSVASGFDGPGVNVGNGTYSIGTYDQPRRTTSTDYGVTSGFTYNADTTVFRNTWRSAADAWIDWFTANAPNTRIHKYGADEPPVTTDTLIFNSMRQKSRWLKQNPSGKILKYLSTTNIRPDLRDVVDIWMSVGPSQYNNGDIWNRYPGGYMIDSAIAARARGELAGIYNQSTPSFGGANTLDVPATWPRATAWVMKKYAVDLYELWYSNYWNDGVAGTIDPWAADKRNNAWGDGSFFAAGENKNSTIGNGRGLAGPIATVRMKNWRRGAQDYEYLYLAEQLGVSSTTVSAIQNFIVPKAFEQTNSTPPGIGKSPASWKTRGYDYELKRRELAGLIEAAPLAFVPTGKIVVVEDSLPIGGGTVTVDWESQNATTATIRENNGSDVSVALGGTANYNLTVNTIFTLTLANSYGSTLYRDTVYVEQADPPEGTFVLYPETLPQGGGIVLVQWDIKYADSVRLVNSAGDTSSVAAIGSVLDTLISKGWYPKILLMYSFYGTTSYSDSAYVTPYKYALPIGF